jgi:ABC-2 type transport system permease protein
MNRPSALLRLLAAYARANAQAALEYRASLVSQALAMVINDALWVAFWASYFDRFALPGWTRADVVTLWALVATSVGLADTFFGNAGRLAGLIARGELDFYLTLPKPPLLHLLIGRMKLFAPGDVAFGLLAFGLFRRPSAVEWALFALCALTGATIVVSYGVIAGSLAFWLGRAESVAGQLFNTMVHFSTYPTPIFKGAARVLLHTLVPAAFLATVPVELLQEPRPLLAGELLAVAAALAALSGAVFRAGLSRYTSGNLLAARE